MKFKFIMKNSIRAIMAILSIIILVGAGLIISRLVIYGMDTFSVVSLVFAVIVEVMFALLEFNTNYVFAEDELIINLGIMKQKIKYTDILTAKNYINEKELFIIFRPQKPKDEGDLSQILVNVKKEQYTDFVELLKSKNDMIIYDEIDKNIKEEN